MRARTGLLLAVLISILPALAGCSGDSGSKPDPDAALVKTVADRAACRDVQRVFLHLAEVSGHWNSSKKPFDPVVARALNPYNHQLRLQARTADTVQLRVVIERNADALGALTQAMLSRHQVRVDAAIAESRKAYAALPACAHRDGKRSLPLKTPTVRPSSGSSRTTAPAAVDASCAQVKKAYDRLSPVTGRWNVEKRPFDPSTISALRRTAKDLRAAEAKAVQVPVQRTLEANARAFDHLAGVMAAHKKAAVRQAIIDMQQTAVDVAALCPLG
ncbi:MAG: hypothetical protein J7518_13985 [Nocardioidaceae bacterium]|nr:hypothetical protein [Nocardioidaceae bacterium]